MIRLFTIEQKVGFLREGCVQTNLMYLCIHDGVVSMYSTAHEQVNNCTCMTRRVLASEDMSDHKHVHTVLYCRLCVYSRVNYNVRVDQEPFRLASNC